ncbi:hypothetical protein KGS77_00180 [Streptomyces sp. MST-110588]|nr:hypothetical protein KGS77_00180 [Streptomyces sp. MST-110588]
MRLASPSLTQKEPHQLVERGEIVSKNVEAVMRKVERHRFTPGASLEDAYRPCNALVIKRNKRGVAASSVSAPQTQAFMLEQAQIRPGMRVLEIGSGGLSAAYLAELVGEGGEVTTVDIDPEITGRAAQVPRVLEPWSPEAPQRQADGVPTVWCRGAS